MARGRLRARVQKNTQARHARQDQAQEARLKKKDAKQVKRQTNRYAKQTKRIEGRGVKQQARLSTRQAKKLGKIYGELDPEDVNRINQVQPYVGAMAEELQEDGVALEDPYDPIEVSAKYIQLNEDTDNPVDEEVYNNAFIDTPEDFDSHFDWEKAKQTAKRALKGALGGIANEATSYISEIEDKKRAGMQLSAQEQKLLDAKGKAIDVGAKIGMDYVMEQLKTWLPWIIGIAVVIYIVKKKS